jgi:hypothetical protein
VAVEQQVLGLQVAVDDVVRVQVVEGERDLGGVELGDGVGEALGLAQQTKQLPALDKVHDHVQVLRILKGAPESNQERMLDLLEHAALVVGVLDLLHLDDLRLLEHLDGIEALVVFGLHEMHAPEAAGAEGALDLEVAEAWRRKVSSRITCRALYALYLPLVTRVWLRGCVWKSTLAGASGVLEGWMRFWIDGCICGGGDGEAVLMASAGLGGAAGGGLVAVAVVLFADRADSLVFVLCRWNEPEVRAVAVGVRGDESRTGDVGLVRPSSFFFFLLKMERFGMETAAGPGPSLRRAGLHGLEVRATEAIGCAGGGNGKQGDTEDGDEVCDRGRWSLGDDSRGEARCQGAVR